MNKILAEFIKALPITGRFEEQVSIIKNILNSQEKISGTQPESECPECGGSREVEDYTYMSGGGVFTKNKPCTKCAKENR